jgi:hypothetical protein
MLSHNFISVNVLDLQLVEGIAGVAYITEGLHAGAVGMAKVRIQA